MSAMGVVTVDGKPLSLPNEVINAGTESIRCALAVEIPDIENADIRIESTGGGARVSSSATVVKRATTKF